MKIAVNTRLLLKGRLDGIGWFSYETLKRLTRQHPEHEFIFLFDRPWPPEFIFSPNVTPRLLNPPARHPLLWYVWIEWSVRRFLNSEKPDVFLSPDGYIPMRSKVPCISVIHDINFLHRPGDLPFFARWYYNRYFPLFAHKAARIGTVSEYSRADICRSYGIDPGKVHVVYNGANDQYHPLDRGKIRVIRDQLTAGAPYFVFVGTMHPRKNVPNMLRAFERFREQYPKPYKIVLVGSKTFLTGEIDRVLGEMKFSHDVLFTGRLEPESLHEVVASAEAMVFVPYIEGFGIPLLEAMKCGVPVITSNTTSLPEVAAGATLMNSPDDVDGIAASMLLVAQNEPVRKELSEKELRRAKDFSWDNSAEALWKLIEKTVSNA